MNRLRARLHAGDAARGAGLVELLVGSALFVVMSGLVLGTTVTTGKAARAHREVNDLNEEARVLLNRMSRELREAKEIRSVVNPVGAGYVATADSSITFWVDLDGDGLDELDAAGNQVAGQEPEVITYKYDYDPNGGRVLLQVPGQTEPVLAGQVTDWRITYTSSNYLYDGSLDGVKDGTVTWEELDGYPNGSSVGDGDRVLDAELDSVDAVNIDFTVFKQPRSQQYRTQVALRNKA